MEKTQFAKNILEEINNDITKLNREYICNTTQLASLEEINNLFGSFAEFKAFVLNGISTGAFGQQVEQPQEPVQQPVPQAEEPAPQAEEPTTPQGLEGVGIGNPTTTTTTQPTTKGIYVTNHSGQTRLVKCPVQTSLKTILAAVGVDTEQGFEVRVNNTLEVDMDSVPEDGARVSAMKQIKGNM